MPGSAAFIIDIAGAKLRSEFASADSMRFFAVWHRSAVDAAQSASVSQRQKRSPVLVVDSRFFLLLNHDVRRCVVLAYYTYRAT